MTETATTFSSLLAPVDCGHVQIRNRLAVAPMSRVSTAGDGIPTERMSSYYQAFAQGGFGMVITEGIYPDNRHSQGYRNQPGFVTSEQTEGWRKIVSGMHAHGAIAIAQIMHAGALSQHLPETFAPSRVQPLGTKMPEYGGDGAYPVPTAMTLADIADTVESFRSAALNARAAGFDGVEIHAANGYLLDQFITRYTNTRSDGYGGRTRDRVRMTGEIVEAVLAATGPEFVVGVRLSQTKVNDFNYRWQGKCEAAQIFAALASAGASYLHLASEGRDWRQTASTGSGPTVTALAREVTGLPVIANGGLHDPRLGEELLNSGEADIIAIGRGALANPDLPRRIANRQVLAPFEAGSIHPHASLENTDSWLQRQTM